MNEYTTALYALLKKAKEQVARNAELRDPHRHQSHDDYAEGVAEGLKQAHDLLSNQRYRL